ncbi:hypothetical protein [Zeaxanthinibacter enoshimensis]|uniref:Uncharacterized protein n=1 Tax=Zeaxanthinibacter enoshimensis TaxID=392009 RepID=A0A4R6TRM0_9FLAO|nr:hypothetical protein [Zeaxanthinibacter enoshimensis]TDQ32967.1 hypothetical protein CLV82_0805 [Zeaxanthinibacter enoshimensis]
MKKKEWYYLLGTLSGGIGLGILLLGTESLKANSHTAFNLYDTYYDFPSFYAHIAIVVLSFFVIYLGRMVYNNFRITVVNLVFIAATILMMTLICGLTTILKDAVQAVGQTDIMSGEDWSGNLHNLLTISQGVLLSLLGISGIKTLKLLNTRYFY